MKRLLSLVWSGGCLSHDHCTTPGPLRQFSTKPDTLSSLRKGQVRMENKKTSTDVNLTALEILQALTGELPCYASPTWEKVRQEESPAREEKMARNRDGTTA